MAKASDLRNKMGTGGVGGMAGSVGGFGNIPAKAPASVIVPSEKDADVRKDKDREDHEHERNTHHNSSHTTGGKAAKPLGGAGGAAGRPKV